MRKDVIQHIKSCQCQLYREKHDKADGLLRPIGLILEKVGLDFVGPMVTANYKSRYNVVCVDYFSKWAIAKAVTDITTERTASLIVEDLVFQHGVPGSIITDQSPKFNAILYKQLLTSLKIDKLRTTAYHPQSKGQVKRTSGALICSLIEFVKRDPNKWELFLPLVTYARNTSINSP